MSYEITKERELLILLSKSRLSSSEEERVREIIDARPDWKEILYQGTTHRLLGLLYYHLKRLRLQDWIERDLGNLLALHFAAIGEKNRAYYGELRAIADGFNRVGVRAALLKGPLLAWSVYPTIEARYSNDLDFLVSLSDVNRITEVLNGIGYVQGIVDKETDTIIPANRKQKIFHQMSTHELQEFLKPSENALVGRFAVDINHSILWGGRCPYTIDTAALLSRALTVEIAGQDVVRLNAEDCLLQLCCHLYREATMAHWIEDSRDLKIYKFADIINYVERFDQDINWSRFERQIEEAGVNELVYYVLHHVTLLYGTGSCSDALCSTMERIRPRDLAFLDEYTLESGERRRWRQGFLDRLFNTNRILEVGAGGPREDQFESVKEGL
jgi:hypothetical protein